MINSILKLSLITISILKLRDNEKVVEGEKENGKQISNFNGTMNNTTILKYVSHYTILIVLIITLCASL